jgi:hypothetical protein
MPLFEIPDDLLENAEDGFNQMLETFGRTCRLIYPARFVECTNCIYDPIGKKSSNRWRNGGPMPFHSGVCPLCNAQGRRATENYDDITMTVNWVPGRYLRPTENIRVDIGSVIETRGYIADLNKVKSCQDMIVIGEVEPYGKYRFKLDGEPISTFQFVKGKYFNAKWIRIG